jgi:hypothetical protein
MYASSPSTLQTLLLLLFMAFVAGDGISGAVSRTETENQYQTAGLVAKYQPDASGDDTQVNACLPRRDADGLNTATLNLAEILSPVSASDAYPSSILHGPPASSAPA